MQAAVEEFIENGFQAATMGQIAKRAAVSRRTLYKNFENKQMLFEAILELLLEKGRIGHDYGYDPDRDLLQQLTEVAHKTVEVMTADDFVNLMRVTFSEFVRQPDVARKTLIESGRLDSKLQDFLQAAIDDGKLRDAGASYMSKQFGTLIKAFSFWPNLLVGEKVDPQRLPFLVEDSVQMFLTHFSRE